MNHETHLGLMKVRELLKRFSVFIYTGSQLDDIVLMELELDDLLAEKLIEADEFREMKLHLRRASREVGGEQ